MVKRMDELVFEVVQEAGSGYCAECLTESIFTQADSWEELRRTGQRSTSSRSPRDSVCRVKIPRDLSGQQLVRALCSRWEYVLAAI
jgi:hypothetical protein